MRVLPALQYIARRSIVSSAPSRKALPLSLNTYRNAQLHDDRDHDQSPMLRMLMFGKPGSGKGTLTSFLVEKYDIQSLSTGDLLRQHIAEGTEVGRQAEEVVSRGGLVPDQLMLKVVSSKLDLLHNKHWILDGFPRTLGQGKLLDSHLRQKNTPLTLVVNLNVPDLVIVNRVIDRWVHLPSGRVYSLSYNPPKVEGRDDRTGEPLVKRPDDNPEIINRRLAQFYASTSPLLSYYETTSAPRTSATRNLHQHPHQLAFHPPSPKLKIKTLTGMTSDENWYDLDSFIRTAFPGVKERIDSRKINGPSLIVSRLYGRARS